MTGNRCDRCGDTYATETFDGTTVHRSCGCSFPPGAGQLDK